MRSDTDQSTRSLKRELLHRLLELAPSPRKLLGCLGDFEWSHRRHLTAARLFRQAARRPPCDRPHSPLTRRLLHLAEQLESPHPPLPRRIALSLLRATGYHRLAADQIHCRQPEKARALFLLSQRHLEHSLPWTLPAAVPLTSRLAGELHRLGQTRPADRLLQRTLWLAVRQRTGPFLRAECWAGLARLRRLEGCLRQAETAADISVAIYRRHLEPHHPGVIPSLDLLAIVLRDLGDSRCCDLWTESLRLKARTLGSQSPVFRRALDDLVTTFRDMGLTTRARFEALRHAASLDDGDPEG